MYKEKTELISKDHDLLLISVSRVVFAKISGIHSDIINKIRMENRCLP